MSSLLIDFDIEIEAELWYTLCYKINYSWKNQWVCFGKSSIEMFWL